MDIKQRELNCFASEITFFTLLTRSSLAICTSLLSLLFSKDSLHGKTMGAFFRELFLGTTGRGPLRCLAASFSRTHLGSRTWSLHQFAFAPARACCSVPSEGLHFPCASWFSVSDLHSRRKSTLFVDYQQSILTCEIRELFLSTG